MNPARYFHTAWPVKSKFKFEVRTNILEIDYPHYHDFHELSLIIKGGINYVTKNMKENHPVGTLLFTREGEIHGKQASGPIKLLQVGFPTETLMALGKYLGNEYDMAELLRPKKSPHVFLYEKDIWEIEKEFDELFMALDHKKTFKQYRLLLDLVAFFFTKKERRHHVKYIWLANAMAKMEETQNFVEGIPALLRLTGRCHEHVGRCLKEEYDISPSTFVTNLRLKYAEGLLRHSEIDILTIAADSGFNTPSHFYAQFKKKYNLTPLQYRKRHYVSIAFIDATFSDSNTVF